MVNELLNIYREIFVSESRMWSPVPRRSSSGGEAINVPDFGPEV